MNYDEHDWRYNQIIPIEERDLGNIGKFTTEKTLEALTKPSPGNLQKMAIDKNGTFWFSYYFCSYSAHSSTSYSNFLSYTKDNDSTFYFDKSNTGNFLDKDIRICAIETDQIGNIWLEKFDAIYKYDGKTWKKVLTLGRKFEQKVVTIGELRNFPFHSLYKIIIPCELVRPKVLCCSKNKD